jgi:3-oxoacyl-[acyl-carrier-protein] synthase II
VRTPVITGIGVVSSIGTGLRAFWDALSEGRCGIGEVSLFDTSGYRGRPGAQVRGVDPNDAVSHAPACGVRFRKSRLSRCDILGLMAACEALTDAGYERCRIPSDRVSVVMGAGGGGLLSGEAFRKQVFNKQRARPSLLVPFTAGAFTNAVAWLAGSTGVLSTISTACSSSATAIGIAGDLIRSGRADVVITGGSEALSETTFSGFNSLRAVDEVPCRPFDLNRKGISLGEGAAVFVVEALEERFCESPPYAEIGGYGITADAYHATAPAPDGLCVGRAIEDALRAADVSPDDIGYINAHGTGTRANDLAETNAIKAVFGPRAYDVPVSSTKSMVGHCLGAAGALETAASILPFMRSVVPPTVNYETPDPECDLDYVPNKGRTVDGVNAVLSNSLAFGGNNTALVLKRFS